MRTLTCAAALAFAFVPAFAGAATAPAPVQPAATEAPGPAFDATQFAPFKKRGSGTIDGVFALAAVGGNATPIAGATVECYPDIAYAAWALSKEAKAINKGNENAAVDAKLRAFIRVTKTDADGNFHFSGLPRGKYVMRANFLQTFPRQVSGPNDPISIPGQPPVPKTGPTVFDVTHAWFDSSPVYVGGKSPPPPTFHMVARHDRFDPRR